MPFMASPVTPQSSYGFWLLQIFGSEEVMGKTSLFAPGADL